MRIGRDEERRGWVRRAGGASWEWGGWGRGCTHLYHLIAQSSTRWYDLPLQIRYIIRIWNTSSYFGYRYVTIAMDCWNCKQLRRRSEIHTYKILVGNGERKRKLRIPNCRRKENMNIVLRQTWYDVRIEFRIGSCERGNEISNSIRRAGISWLAEKLSASQEGF
jgi:hypothetical protein